MRDSYHTRSKCPLVCDSRTNNKEQPPLEELAFVCACRPLVVIDIFCLLSIFFLLLLLFIFLDCPQMNRMLDRH